MLKGKGKFNVYGSKAIISIPSAIWRDSQYPFKKGEKVMINIAEEKLIIKKIEKHNSFAGEEKVVLVVDDEPEIQELIKTYLPSARFEVYSAYSGEEGIEKYEDLMERGKKPDLVIMDLNLSGSKKIEDIVKQMKGEEMDGVKTTQKIINIDPDANIIGFTAFADLEWGQKLKEIGAKEVLSRSVGFEEFAKKVEEILT
ncbi:MAG TPA: response regulator [Thermoplasmatales archaeon]|nr:response regulator [Thermoplasmatales archaeon]